MDIDVEDAQEYQKHPVGTVIDISTAFKETATINPDAVMFGSPYVEQPLSAVIPAVLSTTSLAHMKQSMLIEEDVEDELLAPEHNPLPVSSLRTGMCYDVRMQYHDDIHDSTASDRHPEDPLRIYRIYKELCNAGFVEEYEGSKSRTKEELMKRIRAREATREEILLCHSSEHWDRIQRTATMSKQELRDLTHETDSVYFNRESAFCARLSCGGAIETAAAVVEGKVKNAIAIVRPPGHHAEPDEARGFSLFNNAAITARVMQKRYPGSQRILILDWDVHHGNGTQRIFYEDPSVLYISLHRYEDGNFYPDLAKDKNGFANHKSCGAGSGLGKNVNIPWPCAGMGDGEYIYAFQKAVMPIAYEFAPDLVIVSAGFDAAAGDQLGECFVTPAAYGHMTHMLMSLANGKVVLLLEGGYNLDSISRSALACTKVLMGEPPDELHSIYANEAAVDTVHKVVQEQSKYWKCMNPTLLESDGDDPTVARLHDVIRSYQTKQLFEKWGMVKLPIYSNKVSPTYREQAVCTPNMWTAETLIFMIHSAPDVWLSAGALSSAAELHQSYLLDSGSMYIDWAVSNGHAFVDVNVPAMISGPENEGYNIRQATKDLCLYLWDNYLELADAKDIIFIGVGEGYPGIVHLLQNRSCMSRVKGMINFVPMNMPLKAWVHDLDKDWYYLKSIVYTAVDHPAWKTGKKIRRMYGRATKGVSNEMNKLLSENYAQATAFIGAILNKAAAARRGQATIDTSMSAESMAE
ncbi:hypothetical protein SAICODRAFT_19094 [Saitoella complicata NRRL Y-17804]|uniref:uncharacterized protein n=1 Tax=Saitoella complicata (strain BCRC 22490 / CBS 7301 / JCM 7358 / NBRC 10748 / NRRL Y-17804) TaxID=698492 RepID=UPI000867BE21|nr:uncharacterized protein SAICODRAFT_19094 [Saitoella complicata NRRL Y-17804]ODQ53166.1 hypothetical protein SAICODRAFT_19094 [Saitoella complicata NRRL Y-17804]